MQISTLRRGTRLVRALCLGAWLACVGCGERRADVSGKATVDGKPLVKSEDLSAAVKASAGKALKFSAVRGGQRIEVTVTPEKRDSDRELLLRWTQPRRLSTVLLYEQQLGQQLGVVRSLRLPRRSLKGRLRFRKHLHGDDRLA